MKINITLLLLLLLLFTGCTKSYTPSEMRDKIFISHAEVEDIAIRSCTDYGQSYLLHYTEDLKSWSVVCYQESPVKHFIKVI